MTTEEMKAESGRFFIALASALPENYVLTEHPHLTHSRYLAMPDSSPRHLLTVDLEFRGKNSVSVRVHTEYSSDIRRWFKSRAYKTVEIGEVVRKITTQVRTHYEQAVNSRKIYNERMDKEADEREKNREFENQALERLRQKFPDIFKEKDIWRKQLIKSEVFDGGLKIYGEKSFSFNVNVWSEEVAEKLLSFLDSISKSDTV